MAWQSYSLDRKAQKLVLDAIQRDSASTNQAYKMRMAVPYGLERFWGEHLRLYERESNKSRYWKETWDSLVQIMGEAGVKIPNPSVNANNVEQIRDMSNLLWNISKEDQRVILSVLTQLCDSIIWWTQRYKSSRTNDE